MGALSPEPQWLRDILRTPLGDSRTSYKPSVASPVVEFKRILKICFGNRWLMIYWVLLRFFVMMLMVLCSLLCVVSLNVRNISVSFLALRSLGGGVRWWSFADHWQQTHLRIQSLSAARVLGPAYRESLRQVRSVSSRLKPNTHRRRHLTVELSRVSGVYGIRN